MADTQTQPGRTRFLDLPCELRNGIYKFLLPMDEFVVLGCSSSSHSSGPESRAAWARAGTNVLLLNKQISAEGLEMFYRSNRFVLYLDDPVVLVLGGLPQANRRDIRRLILDFHIVRWERLPLRPQLPFEEELWAPLLENLAELDIVACIADLQCCSDGRLMQYDINWFEPLIKGIDRLLPRHVKVRLDEWCRCDEFRKMLRDILSNPYLITNTEWGNTHHGR
jgi:hypothetical protein